MIPRGSTRQDVTKATVFLVLGMIWVLALWRFGA